MWAQWTQAFPGKPAFTEEDAGSQGGKIFVITGGTSGVGLELAKMLYALGGKLYITARSEEKARVAIERIVDSTPRTPATGQIDYILLELSDLSTIKKSAEAFLGKETKLHVLFNNAGVSLPPRGAKSAQGHDLTMATNCLGPLLFTRLMLPALERAAAAAAPGIVRVVWTGSQIFEVQPPAGGFTMEQVRNPPDDRDANYVWSKLGNWLLAGELVQGLRPLGILSLALNPGALDTALLKDMVWWRKVAFGWLLHDPKLGAYTELFAGVSTDLTMDDAGGYLIPWGRRHPGLSKDLLRCIATREEGGTGLSKEFLDWCKEQIAKYS